MQIPAPSGWTPGAITIPTVITVASATPGLTINQSGAGGGLLVTNTGAGYTAKFQDSADPDSTPVIIDAAGNTGFGIAVPLVLVHVDGMFRVSRIGTPAQYVELSVAGGVTLLNSIQSVEHRINNVLIATVAGAAITSAVPILLPAGAVGTPALTRTGDLDTGVWFPAANTVAISTNGAQAITVDPLGNLLIGVTAAGTTAAKTIQLSDGTAPTANIVGVQLYSVGGVLFARGSAGTVTQLTLVP